MSQNYDFDYVVIGSGFGGSVSAYRLSEKGYSVGVMEMGRRWKPEDFPKTNWEVRRWMWRPGVKLFGFFNMRFFRHVLILSGHGVGGGSLTFANVLPRPRDKVWDEGDWAGLADWKRIMPQHYATAERMLGVTENRILGEADLRLKKMADLQGVGDTFYNAPVATFFGPEGEAGGKVHPDPYFGGEGPARGSCVGCGGCMVGCRHDAKNTLDKNYLYLAEKRGAEVFAETKVVDVRPLNGKDDGSDGYEVHTESSTRWFGKQRRSFRCRGVVFSASSVGTVELMLRLRHVGSLPNISDDLGKRMRTNAETVLGVRFPSNDKSMSPGVAGGSGLYVDERTHIEAARFPEGSDAIGLLMTLLCGGRAGWTRIFTWLWNILRNPVAGLQAHNPFGFARQSLLLLVMQTVDAYLNMRLKRPWYWPFALRLTTEAGPVPIPTVIPEGIDFATKGAKALGGIATSLQGEILFNLPSTAHCMGGCAMADSPERGVIDMQGRVFGYRNLLVCDGSMLCANLGVNPSLTITALTEHAMSHVPAKLVPLRDPQSRRLENVSASHVG